MSIGRIKNSRPPYRPKAKAPVDGVTDGVSEGVNNGVKDDKMKDEEKDEKVESQDTEVAEFIDCLLVGAAIVHKMHLRVTGSGSFAEHKALNELYDALPDHADDLAEKYQGYKGIILPDVAEVDQAEYLKMTPIAYVEYLIKYVTAYRKCFGDDSALQNLVDELQGTLYSTRYKLKFLS